MKIENEAGTAAHSPAKDAKVRPRRRRWPWMLAAGTAALLISTT